MTESYAREPYRRVIATLLMLLLILIASATSRVHSADDSEPFFPFGAFDKARIEPGTPAWREYCDRIVRTMIRYNLNTLLTVPYKDAGDAEYLLDLLYENDLRAVFSAGNPLNRSWATPEWGSPFTAVYAHPAVIAYKIGNEPKDAAQLDRLRRQYEAVSRNFDKPIITAFIGESMRDDPQDFVIRAWQTLDARIKFARHYPIRREFDLVNWSRPKMTMSFQAWAAMMETAHDGRPWWYVPQMFGKGLDRTNRSFWRFPSAAETGAMLHVALAHGARGIIGWPLQKYDEDRKPMRVMMLDENLQPATALDGSRPIERYAAVGALTRHHAGLLLRHERGDFGLRSSNERVIAVPRRDPATGDRLAYVVNLDAEATQAAELTLTGFRVGAASDVYTGEVAEVAGASGRISLLLEPGGASFLQLLDAD